MITRFVELCDTVRVYTLQFTFTYTKCQQSHRCRRLVSASNGGVPFIPLWQEDGSVIYNFCWPRQRSYSDLSPTGLIAMFHTDSRLLQSGGPGPRIYAPLGTEWPSCTPRHWVSFSSPPGTLAAPVEVFEPAFTRGTTPCLVFLIPQLKSFWSWYVILALRCYACRLSYTPLKFVLQNC
jgi:hypothetical protein